MHGQDHTVKLKQEEAALSAETQPGLSQQTLEANTTAVVRSGDIRLSLPSVEVKVKPEKGVHACSVLYTVLLLLHARASSGLQRPRLCCYVLGAC